MADVNQEDPTLEMVRDWLPEGAEVLLTFPVLHAGWEMDQRGWIVRLPDGEERCVLTNHGFPNWAEEAELVRLIEQYDRAMAGAAQALDAIRGKRDPGLAREGEVE